MRRTYVGVYVIRRVGVRCTEAFVLRKELLQSQLQPQSFFPQPPSKACTHQTRQKSSGWTGSHQSQTCTFLFSYLVKSVYHARSRTHAFEPVCKHTLGFNVRVIMFFHTKNNKKICILVLEYQKSLNTLYNRANGTKEKRNIVKKSSTGTHENTR